MHPWLYLTSNVACCFLQVVDWFFDADGLSKVPDHGNDLERK